MNSSTGTSISSRNSSNKSFYLLQNHHRTSLLCHPNGLYLIQQYDKKIKEGLDIVDRDFANKMAEEIKNILSENELNITKTFVNFVKNEWCFIHEDGCAISSENEEEILGKLDGSFFRGKPDGVIRKNNVHLDKDTTTKKVQWIIEFSLNKNGGEKKIGQAFDYASLIDDPNKTIVLVHVHFDRKREDYLKITQEAFIFLHDEEEKQRKLGFLWREFYVTSEKKNKNEVIQDFCKGLTRCLEISWHNEEGHYLNPINTDFSEWHFVSDNVAIHKNKDVYKAFDNRFHPTHRRPDEWLNRNQPWIQPLNVKEVIDFKESGDVDILGRPKNKKRSFDSDKPKFDSHTTYPRGSLCVIKYKYQDGTHYASRVSHFQQIADSIAEMHKADRVHGDIRGFNMLHPFPKDDVKHNEGIKKSLLIDFDLTGTPGIDRYPPGYQPKVDDNELNRSGVAGAIMQKVDDWKDLGSVMACYSISPSHYKEKQEEWSELWKTLAKGNTKEETTMNLLKKFVNDHGDLEININEGKRWNMDRIIVKGTGSPNKLEQKPRGELGIENTT